MNLDDRMKLYENLECGRRLMPRLPVLARIDGRAFSHFTAGMDRPFDERFVLCMRETTIELVRETGAQVGYTQSDEISLGWYSADQRSQLWFDGRVAKMTSQLAAQATLHFYRNVQRFFPERFANRLPTFDARVWTVPTLEEAANVFLWRELDATKNSLGMLASANFSHLQLLGKSTADRHNMLHSIGINWNDLPPNQKRGTYVQRVLVRRRFSAAELAELPEKHAARQNPNLIRERHEVQPVGMPPLATIPNRVGVLFLGEEPNVCEEVPA